MKKTALVCLLALSMSMFVGCGKDDKDVDAPPAAPQQMEEQQPEGTPDANITEPTEAPVDNGATDGQTNPENAAPSNADVTDETVNDADAPTDGAENVDSEDKE